MSEKLRLWLDGQCLQTKNRRRGIGLYIEGLIQGIIKYCPDVDLHISLNAGIPEEALAARDRLSNWIKSDNIHVWHGVATDGEAIEGLTERRRLSEIALAHHVASIAPDIALSTNPFEGSDDRAVPLMPNEISCVPIASIFYGASSSQFPDRHIIGGLPSQCYQRRLAAFRDFDCNICISDVAKQELVDLISNNRSISIHSEISNTPGNRLAPSPLKQQPEQKSVLYLGGFELCKHVQALMEAISILEDNHKTIIKLFVAGGCSTDAETALRLHWSALGLPNESLQFIGQIGDDALIDYCLKVQVVIQTASIELSGLTELEIVLSGVSVVTLDTSMQLNVDRDISTSSNHACWADLGRRISHLFRDVEVAQPREAIGGLRGFSFQPMVRRTVDALIKVAERHPTSPSSRDEGSITGRVLLATNELKLPEDLIAGCLARSEIRKAGARRLIVDATATVISDGGSGIQRVVKKICTTIHSDVRTPVIIGFSDSSSEWFEIIDRRLDLGPVNIKQNGSRIFFTQHDHILMLDSSWAFHKAHSHNLTSARLRGAKVTTCLYDTVPLRASGFTHSRMPPIFTQWLLSALNYSTGFVCISKAVADELLEILKELRFPRPLNIGFWPLGADFGPVFEKGPKGAPETPTTKFLMVGTIEPRKGYGVALDAFDSLWEKNIDVQLTIVGKMGWNVQSLVRRLETHPQWGRRLFWRSDATDIELSHEYACADCLVASSFAEGFGLPIVEAGYFGKPIIASDIPVFREVSSKSVGAEFFAVGDPRSLAESVCSFIASSQDTMTDPKPRQRWENWSQSAERLKEVILQDKWYCRYIPEAESLFANPSAIGRFEMTEPLNDTHRKHSLLLVDGPMNADTEDAQKFVVRITNESDRLWSSQGRSDGTMGVFLGCRLVGPQGKCMRVGNRAMIPLVIAPGDTVYMPIEVFNDWLIHEDAVVHIEMLQDGVGWWGKPLKLPIREISAAAVCA